MMVEPAEELHKGIEILDGRLLDIWSRVHWAIDRAAAKDAWRTHLLNKPLVPTAEELRAARGRLERALAASRGTISG